VPAAGGVVHCFTGNYQEACWYLDHGLLLSFTGIISFRNAGELRDVAARVPLDSMMLETDSPYLAPEPKRGKRNEPGYVVHVAEAMARARDCSLEEVARATTANAEKMFFS
jgi:TatD DNase family protein